MSNNQQLQAPNNARRPLILIVVAVIIGVGWYALQGRDNAANQTPEEASQSQEAEATNSSQNEYQGWQSYSWADQSVSFKHPDGWTTQENAAMGRLYVKNSDVNLLKEDAPEGFQQIWFSNNADEASEARE